MSFIDFGFLDALDILLVAFLLYQLYRLIKGTVAINIFIGVAAIYLIWKLVEALQMDLLSEILGKFIGVGVLALVIVFQQEIRKFLLLLGSTNFSSRRRFLRQLKWLNRGADGSELPMDQLVSACRSMARSKTGALMVIERQGQLGSYASTGTSVEGRVSSGLLRSIFNKYSPLHDGAVILRGSNLVSAGCILPVTERNDVPSRFGLRHRAGIGIAEKTDAIALIVSEESGSISIAVDEEFVTKVKPDELAAKLKSYMD